MIQEAIKNILSKLDTMLEFDEGIDVNSVEELKSKYDTFVKENFPEAQEEKQLLLVDLCGRLPYGVKVLYEGQVKEIQYIEPLYNELKLLDFSDYTIGIEEIKPYLRPMSSMTEEEKKEFIDAVTWEANGKFYIDESEDITFYQEKYDWLDKKMFDYRGLIPNELALEAPEGMYNI